MERDFGKAILELDAIGWWALIMCNKSCPIHERKVKTDEAVLDGNEMTRDVYLDCTPEVPLG